MSEREFKLYDTLTKEVKPLKLIEDKHLRFYSCGPTVYSYAHIGNFRTFITSDLVVRTAEALGWKVTYVSNITDVGHLTEDDIADAAGEDKMAKALKSKEGQNFANIWDLARFYANILESDWKRLNLKTPQVRPRATDHMREQIQAIEELIDAGYAYETPTGVYFEEDKFENYGKLSGNIDRSSLQVAVRDVVQDPNKKNPADFALWKKDNKHLMQWFSPWGWGFPGWHIECSVMAKKYLGETIDLHGGGEDLKFPHHECEIAQAESISGTTFCNHWMHVTFLQVDGEKMSKSKGTFYTVQDILDEGFDPLALRLALITVPYNKSLNFTMQGLADANNHIERFRECDRRIETSLNNGEVDPAEDKDLSLSLNLLVENALDAMTNDLNTAIALREIFEGVKTILRLDQLTPAQAISSQNYLNNVNDLLGIVYHDSPLDSTSTEDESELTFEGKPITEWIEERNTAKAAKDYHLSDKIRDDLASVGIVLKDTPDGTIWSKS